MTYNIPRVLLLIFKSISLVSSTGDASLTLRVYFRSANWPSAQFANSTIKNDLQATGTGTAFLSRQGSVLVSLSLSLLVSRVSVVAYLAQETPLFPPPLFAQREKPKKLPPTSYLRGRNINISSTKCRIPPSRNLSSQRHYYYKVYIRWISQSPSQKDLSPKNASAWNYVSHRLSPTCPTRMRSKKRLQNWETSKSRPLSRKTPPSTSGVAQERDPRSIFYACDGGNGCHQETWYLQGL